MFKIFVLLFVLVNSCFYENKVSKSSNVNIEEDGYKKLKDGKLLFKLVDNSGKAVDNAKLELIGDSCHTAINIGRGSYVFEFLFKNSCLGEFTVTIQKEGYLFEGNYKVKLLKRDGELYCKGKSLFVVKPLEIVGKDFQFTVVKGDEIVKKRNFVFELLKEYDEKKCCINSEMIIPLVNGDAHRSFNRLDCGDYRFKFKENDKLLKSGKALISIVNNQIVLFVNGTMYSESMKFLIDEKDAVTKVSIQSYSDSTFIIEKEFELRINNVNLKDILNPELLNVDVNIDSERRSKNEIRILSSKLKISEGNGNKLAVTFMKIGKDAINIQLRINICYGKSIFSETVRLRCYFNEINASFNIVDPFAESDNSDIVIAFNANYFVARLEMYDNTGHSIMLDEDSVKVSEGDDDLSFGIDGNGKLVLPILISSFTKNVLLTVDNYIQKNLSLSFSETELVKDFTIELERYRTNIYALVTGDSTGYELKLAAPTTKKYETYLMLKDINSSCYIVFKKFEHLLNGSSVKFIIPGAVADYTFEKNEKGGLKLYALFKEYDLIDIAAGVSVQELVELRLVSDVNSRFEAINETNLFLTDKNRISIEKCLNNMVYLNGTIFFHNLKDRLLLELFEQHSKVDSEICKLEVLFSVKKASETKFQSIEDAKIEVAAQEGKGYKKGTVSLNLYETGDVLKKHDGTDIYALNLLKTALSSEYSALASSKEGFDICLEIYGKRKINSTVSISSSVPIIFNGSVQQNMEIRVMDDTSVLLFKKNNNIKPIVSSQTFNLILSYERKEQKLIGAGSVFKKVDQFYEHRLMDRKKTGSLVLKANNIVDGTGNFGQNYAQIVQEDSQLVDHLKYGSYAAVILGLGDCLGAFGSSWSQHGGFRRGVDIALIVFGTIGSIVTSDYVRSGGFGNTDSGNWGRNLTDEKTKEELSSAIDSNGAQLNYANQWDMYIYIPNDIYVNDPQSLERCFPKAELKISGYVKLRTIRELFDLDNDLEYRVVEQANSDKSYQKEEIKNKSIINKGWKRLKVRIDKTGSAYKTIPEEGKGGWSVALPLPFKVFRHTAGEIDYVSDEKIHEQEIISE